MSINRWNAKTDTVQAEIVRGLEKVGVEVYVIKQPCDLLCWIRGQDRWRTLETKTPEGKRGQVYRRRRMKKQNDFLDRTNTPVVTSLEEALIALGLVPSPSTSAPCTLKYSSAPSASAVGR